MPVSEEQQEAKISLDLQSVSVRDILDHLVDADSRYEWERYARHFRPTRFINVFPAGAKDEVNNLMNIRTEETVIQGFTPAFVIQNIKTKVRELFHRIHGRALGSVTGSYLTGIDSSIHFEVDFEFRGVTVREILNEVALRTDGGGWVYEFDKSQQHAWSQHRWDVLLPAEN